jgi:hypothetical protein
VRSLAACRRGDANTLAVMVAWRGVCYTRSCPVVEELQGRVQAAGEELIGEVAIG